MGLELTTDRYPPMTSQTRYPLRHVGCFLTFHMMTSFQWHHLTKHLRKTQTYAHRLSLKQNLKNLHPFI